MKVKKEGKLHLNKTTIVNFETRLDRDEQKAIKGGTGNEPAQTTDLAVLC
ncbi:MAG: hypothetical protein GY950_27750 [bacterium]|nr:hypothetical protein [bacterium]